MTVSEWVNRANEEAAKHPEQRPLPGSVQVRVLRAATFNGPNHKSIGTHVVGEIITIAAGAYADSLIADGFVSVDLAEPQAPHPRGRRRKE